MIDLDAHFPRYTDYDPAAPVWCVTPGTPGACHRFFDTSPISPSGRYLAATVMPDETRLPEPGEPADVLLVDLAEGATRVAAVSRGWDSQLGAQAQWGSSDAELYFNDMDVSRWRPFGVRLDPGTGERTELDGTIYMMAPNGKFAVSPDLRKTAITQPGYGAVLPPDRIPDHTGAPDDDGVFITDGATGESRLLISTRVMLEATGQDPDRPGSVYTFHTKVNCRSDRIFVVVRYLPGGGEGMRHQVISFDADGSNPRVAIPEEEWTAKKGHHPDWCADGDHVLMNLNISGPAGPMRLVRARYDGADLASFTDAIVGSGHPAMRRSGRFVVTDAYVQESVSYGDGTTPLRWFDLQSETETVLARIRTLPEFVGPTGELRVDPHPAWDRSGRYVTFNACPDGTRRVYVADLSSMLATGN